MKAMVCDKTGGPEVLRWTEDHPVPKVGDSEVLVKNKYGGVNYIDTYFRTGLYPAPSWPLVLGQEGVGTVAAVGSSNTYGLKEGDEVVFMKQGKFPVYFNMLCLTSKVLTRNTPLCLPIKLSKYRPAFLMKLYWGLS